GLVERDCIRDIGVLPPDERRLRGSHSLALCPGYLARLNKTHVDVWSPMGIGPRASDFERRRICVPATHEPSTPDDFRESGGSAAGDSVLSNPIWRVCSAARARLAGSRWPSRQDRPARRGRRILRSWSVSV